MSFWLTTAQIRNGTKWVTRRLGWWDLEPDELVMACVKCQGLRKGEKIQKIRPIQIVSTRPEPLGAVTEEDVVLEGFPGMSRAAFVAMFLEHMPDAAFEPVNRIEFRYPEEHEEPHECGTTNGEGD